MSSSLLLGGCRGVAWKLEVAKVAPWRRTECPESQWGGQSCIRSVQSVIEIAIEIHSQCQFANGREPLMPMDRDLSVTA